MEDLWTGALQVRRWTVFVRVRINRRALLEKTFRYGFQEEAEEKLFFPRESMLDSSKSRESDEFSKLLAIRNNNSFHLTFTKI